MQHPKKTKKNRIVFLHIYTQKSKKPKLIVKRKKLTEKTNCLRKKTKKKSEAI
jgi:hypothetical protein